VAAFGNRSRENLGTCHPDLRRVMEAVVENFDCSVLEGERGEERQNFLFDSGQSKVQYPDGKHNSTPSMAVDVVPYPIDWENRERFVLFAGYVLGIASQMGIALRWGGDWDSDWDTKETAFFDAPHFELVDEVF
jgi:peptidoglycan L-alanyl-D-glutamate endopeptidase CwlK